MRDMISNTQLIRGANQTLSGTTANASALIDRRGYDALSIYAMLGTVTDAGATAGFTMKLQHSDTTAAADFADVDTAELKANSDGGTTVTVTADTDDDILKGGVGYLGNKRYVRAVFTGTTGTDAVVNILAVLGKPHRAPVSTVGSTTAST